MQFVLAAEPLSGCLGEVLPQELKSRPKTHQALPLQSRRYRIQARDHLISAKKVVESPGRGFLVRIKIHHKDQPKWLE